MNVIEGNVQWLGNASTAIYAVTPLHHLIQYWSADYSLYCSFRERSRNCSSSLRLTAPNNWIISKHYLAIDYANDPLYRGCQITINSIQIFALIHQGWLLVVLTMQMGTIMYQVCEDGKVVQLLAKLCMGVVLAFDYCFNLGCSIQILQPRYWLKRMI